MDFKFLSESLTRRFVWLLIASYVFFFSYICILKYLSFDYFDQDLAIHAQIHWNLLSGKLYNSLLGINFLGNHIHFINFLTAPIYAVFPNVCTLLILQSFAIGLATYPLYLLAKTIIDHRWALLIAFTYLIYPAVGYLNLYEFHPPAYIPLIYFFAFYYFKRGNIKNFC